MPAGVPPGLAVRSLLLALAFLVIAAGGALSVPAARADTPVSGELVEETGPTTILGGGDHVFVRFGTDAAFGIVYGTTANPNHIYVVAIKARYIGVAQVVDPENRTIAQDRPIKIYTLYAIKLDSIFEFRDRNQNGVADYGRLYNATTGRFTDYYSRLIPQADTLYKKVDLRTNWTASPIVRSSDAQNRSWSFNLTARNLSYARIANYTGSLAGPLPTVQFGFHLNASMVQVDNVTVPQWRVVVDTSAGRGVTDITRIEDLYVSGRAVRYNLKWDQEISGWTYAAENGAGDRRRLFLELGAIVGNWIPSAIVDSWFEARVLARIGEAGVARFNTSAGSQTANETSGVGTSVRILQSPLVDFGGNWTRIGRFSWISDSVVDGNSEPVFGQIVSGVRFLAIGESGNAFLGFALLSGLSFLGGDSIVHDPAVATDIQADLNLPGGSSPGALFAIAVVAAAVTGGLLILALLVLRRRRKGIPPPPTD